MPNRTDVRDVAVEGRTRLVEIRTYTLKPGRAADFVDAFARAMPLVRASMDVVAFGRSEHERETFFLIRAYADRAAMEREQAAFYGSPSWREGPRDALLDCLDTYVNTVLTMSEQAVEDIRHRNGTATVAGSGSD